MSEVAIQCCLSYWTVWTSALSWSKSTPAINFLLHCFLQLSKLWGIVLFSPFLASLSWLYLQNPPPQKKRSHHLANRRCLWVENQGVSPACFESLIQIRCGEPRFTKLRCKFSVSTSEMSWKCQPYSAFALVPTFLGPSWRQFGQPQDLSENSMDQTITNAYGFSHFLDHKTYVIQSHTVHIIGLSTSSQLDRKGRLQ